MYFPRAWKLARISPIPKVYTPVTEDDLRPVSILPVLSKVFEKLVASQMTDFCSRESLLRDTISSFRKGHSTSTILLGIRDDLLSAMKRREVTLMVLADFSKAFDTVCFKTVITKLHHLGFSKNVLEWLANYLCGRRQYVQIDDRKSSPVFSEFGIPQGSILGPMLFNLYVADLQDILPPTVKSFQYADDTTIYSSCTAPQITSQAESMNATLASLGAWSKDSNLSLNSKKTKAILISTPQMAHVHSLGNLELGLEISGTPLERTNVTKLLGVYIDSNLKWGFHISSILKSCYATLRTLRKIRNFTDFKLRKHLVETLILSKISYCDVVFYPLPKFLLARLQRLQFAMASFVTCKYVNSISTILDLNWLPILELRDYSLFKTIFKALYSDNWPSYLNLEVVKPIRHLRSSVAPRLYVPLVQGTFQHSAAIIFNELPANIRNCKDFKEYCRLCKAFLKARALSPP